MSRLSPRRAASIDVILALGPLGSPQLIGPSGDSASAVGSDTVKAYRDRVDQVTTNDIAAA
jgi:hypothetical protein